MSSRALSPGIIPWTLLGYILLSACIHAFGFYVFQTIYPPATHLSPPPMQVGVLTPGTPETDAILRWIDSEDPALAAEPGKAPIPGLENVPYIPSYATVHAQPRVPPAMRKPLQPPAGISGVDLIRMAAAPRQTEAQPATATPPATDLSFSSGLIAEPPAPALAALHASAPGELQPARYLLGVTPKGETRYVFLQASSGDKALDNAAGRLLEQVHFQPGKSDLTWGMATFRWGSSAYAPAETTGSAAP